MTTNDAQLARTLRVLRSSGEEEQHEHRLRGFNYRLDEIQGAILRVKLGHLDTWTEARRLHSPRARSRRAGAGRNRLRRPREDAEGC